MNQPTTDRVRTAVDAFIPWLDAYGETSYDHQSYFAGPFGGGAKALYYRNPLLGIFAVAPMIFSEAFLPAARQLFWKKQRFPIADAHYAMGFAMLAELTGEDQYYQRAVHFLNVLKETRCPDYQHYCWGYPFDWVTKTGVMKTGTPLITTTPYVYEAFSSVYRIDQQDHWLEVMHSIAEHAANDIKDKEISADAAMAGYNPLDTEAGIINASAYRAFLLMSAAEQFSHDEYRQKAERNLNYVLGAQQPNGSWFYATDGFRNFIDHFHTCFVLKALGKITQLVNHEGCNQAIKSGVDYYVEHLFTDDGLPRPFSKRPRITVYRHELYDYAECINLCVLFHGQFDRLDQRLNSTVEDILDHWTKSDGSFRSRQLMLGDDNVPMHRWAQSQLFRSLCFLLKSLAGSPKS